MKPSSFAESPSGGIEAATAVFVEEELSYFWPLQCRIRLDGCGEYLAEGLVASVPETLGSTNQDLALLGHLWERAIAFAEMLVQDLEAGVPSPNGPLLLPIVNNNLVVAHSVAMGIAVQRCCVACPAIGQLPWSGSVGHRCGQKTVLAARASG